MPTTNQRFRVAGSSFTHLTFDGSPLLNARTIAHQTPSPVAPPTPIQPMDARYPTQIIVPQALGVGSITMEIYELYKGKVWDKLGSRGLLAGAVDLVDVFIRIAETKEGSVGMTKVITPPSVAGDDSAPYTEEYHGCVITNIDDSETITIGTMEVVKTITVAYTYRTLGGQASKGFRA